MRLVDVMYVAQCTVSVVHNGLVTAGDPKVN